MASTHEVKVPDLGDFDQVDVIEVLVSVGDTVEVDQDLITLESDKASMGVGSSTAGTVTEVRVAEGDQVAEGDVIVVLEGADATTATAATDDAADSAPSMPAQPGDDAPEPAPTADAAAAEPAPADAPDAPAAPATAGAVERLDEPIDEAAFSTAHAGPGARKLARELGVDLGAVAGSGRKGRVTPDDLKGYVRERLRRGTASRATGSGQLDGFAWPQMPAPDWSKHGEIEVRDLTRVQKIAVRNLHRSWLHVPHVTQHEDADVTELEAFRKRQKAEAERRGHKLTPLAFLLKAVAGALREFPTFNASLHPDGDKLIVKSFVHIGIAVDTDDGLMVPVIRDVDRKGVYELADEVVELAGKARKKRLGPSDLQGGGFTISSLGGIGGTKFTPIVNAPEVAILGVSRNQRQPVWRDGEFVPRLIMPLSLSYDHRVIDGAAAARFCVHLADILSDFPRLLL